MGVTVPALLSFEEFERMPEQPGKQELIHGELFELPPAKFKHNRVSWHLSLRLKAALDAAHSQGAASSLGDVCMEMGYKLGSNWLVPDVSITHAGQTVGEYLEGAPAIAIEVVSPGNTLRHFQAKTEIYFAHGAREVWRVYDDPLRIIIDTGGHYRVVTADEQIVTPLLPGFTPTVRDLTSAV
jgi:Uma2 family endonuclease